MATKFKKITAKDLPFTVREIDTRKRDVKQDLDKAERNLPRLKALCKKHSLPLTIEIVEEVSHGDLSFIEKHYLSQSEGHRATLPSVMQRKALEETYTAINEIKREFEQADNLIQVDAALLDDALEVYPLEHYINMYATRVCTPEGMKLYNAQMDLFKNLEEFAALLNPEHKNYIMTGLKYYAAQGIWDFDHLPNYDKK